MLKKLIIHHFKSLENVEIDFSNITVFVGNNASGKSNVIDAIRLVRDAVSNGLDRAIGDRHGIESVRQWSPTKPYRMSFTILFDEEVTFRGRYHFAIDSARSEFRVAREEAEIYERGVSHQVATDKETGKPRIFERPQHTKKALIRDIKGDAEFTEWKVTAPIGDDTPFNVTMFCQSPTSFDRKPNKRKLKISQSDELFLNLRAHVWEFGSLRSRLSGFQAYSIFPNTLRIPQDPSNETFLAPEGRNLASVFKRMRRTPQGTAAINQITEAMQSLMPNLERISVLTVGGFLVLQFHVIEPTGKRHIFNVSQLSDGTLRVLGLLTALYQVPKPAIIALEEPEQTVNPGILTVLADSIKEVSRRTQVLVTTHSPNLLDQFVPETVKTVELSGGRTRVDNVNARQIEVVKERLFSLGELLTSEGLHG
jgi:predicted ATPase